MSPTFWIILAAPTFAALLLIRALVRNHQAWLARQTPVGAWRVSTATGAITLVFEGGPHEGLYKQITEAANGPVREFGHWSQNKSSLSMLIMASDIPSNPRIGVDA